MHSQRRRCTSLQKMAHLAAICSIIFGLFTVCLAAEQTTCKEFCRPSKELMNTQCIRYLYSRPQPKIYETCQIGFRGAFEHICNHICDNQQHAKLTPKQALKMKKETCKKFKAMIPRPSMYNVCSDGFEKGMSAGTEYGQKSLLQSEESTGEKNTGNSLNDSGDQDKTEEGSEGEHLAKVEAKKEQTTKDTRSEPSSATSEEKEFAEQQADKSVGNEEMKWAKDGSEKGSSSEEEKASSNIGTPDNESTGREDEEAASQSIKESHDRQETEQNGKSGQSDTNEEKSRDSSDKQHSRGPVATEKRSTLKTSKEDRDRQDTEKNENPRQNNNIVNEPQSHDGIDHQIQEEVSTRKTSAEENMGIKSEAAAAEEHEASSQVTGDQTKDTSELKKSESNEEVPGEKETEDSKIGLNVKHEEQT